ncbi:hypothetical protein NPIL_529731, partial [Nephila pilipes]
MPVNTTAVSSIMNTRGGFGNLEVFLSTLEILLFSTITYQINTITLLVWQKFGENEMYCEPMERKVQQFRHENWMQWNSYADNFCGCLLCQQSYRTSCSSLCGA